MAAEYNLGRAINNLGFILYQQGRHEDGLALYRRAAGHVEAAYVESAQRLEYGRTVAIGYRNLALSEKQAGRSEEALRWFAKLLDHWQRMARATRRSPTCTARWSPWRWSWAIISGN